jgi:hypothetical protein
MISNSPRGAGADISACGRAPQSPAALGDDIAWFNLSQNSSLPPTARPRYEGGFTFREEAQ